MLRKLTIMVVAMFTWSATVAFAQKTFSGQVVDAATGQAVVGASVVDKASKAGAATDANGNFSLVLKGKGSLTISFIGYYTTTVPYDVAKSTNLGVIKLEEDPQMLETVVVVGRGVIDLAADRATPIAASTLLKSEIQAVSVGNVEFPEAMKSVPSVHVSGQSGFGDSQMFLRGFDQTNTAFLLNGQPINGMEDGKMYWSNWAGMSDIANAIQVQRGLGSSKLAISSVGGTVNIVSKTTDRKPGGMVRLMGGYGNYFKGTVAYDSGITENGWGVSLLLDHWQGERKWHRGSKGVGQNYFLSVGKEYFDHNFNFLIFGAPQWHANVHSKNEALFRQDPYYNDLFGYDIDGFKSERTNFYHKPVMNFNWDWTIDEKSSLSSVLYASFGRGGGTGPMAGKATKIKNDPIALGNGTFLIDNMVDYAAIRKANAEIEGGIGYDRPADGQESGYVRRASMNNHAWYGLVSNFEHKINDYWTANVGADFRFYHGSHFRQLVDLFGLKGYVARPDKLVATKTYAANPWSALFKYADRKNRIVYDYAEDVNYQGVFGQIEFNQEGFSAFFQGALSNQYYRRYDYFNQTKEDKANNQVSTLKSGAANKLGYNVKGGVAYKFDDNNTLFVNSGYYSRQPFLDNVFAQTAVLASPAVANESIFGLEAGYKLEYEQIKANLNVYHTLWSNRFLQQGVRIFEIATGSELDLSKERPNVSQLHQGVELEVEYRPISMVTFKGYLSVGNWRYSGSADYRVRDYRDGKIMDNSNAHLYTLNTETNEPLPKNFFSGSADVNGVKIDNVPQFTWGLSANLNYKNFYLRPSVNYAGNQYRFTSFSTVAEVVQKGGKYTQSKLDDYLVADLNFGYNLKIDGNTIGINANVMNLFNAKYINHTDQYGVFFGTGRTWNVGVSYKF